VIRDRGPISSIGHGLTSRDLPVQEGESEGPSPNSGFIGKALNGHPIMRFFATTAASVVAMSVGGKMLKGQGLKLAKSIQDSAEAGSAVSTRAVDTITQLRRGLDELEGLSRYLDDGVDPSEFDTDLEMSPEEAQVTDEVADAMSRRNQQIIDELQGMCRRMSFNQERLFHMLKEVSSSATHAAHW
jgi:hypothetical protein